jgi:hypothetical protein
VYSFNYSQILIVISAVTVAMLLLVGVMAFLRTSSRQQALSERKFEIELDEKKAELEFNRQLAFERADLERANREAADKAASERVTEAQLNRWRLDEETRAAKDREAANSGYIFLNLSDAERPFFHDLLIGFEDYARMQGYELSFSIEASQSNRVGFKFTVKGDAVVGPTRIQTDFARYVERMRDGKVDFDDILPPVPTSTQSTIVNSMNSRAEFLERAYRDSEIADRVYKRLLAESRNLLPQPQPAILIQSGGTVDSRRYIASNAHHLVQGDDSNLIENSSGINIGASFSEKSDRINALGEAIEKLGAENDQNGNIRKAVLELSKAKDELSDEGVPNVSKLATLLERAKTFMSGATLTFETVEVCRKAFELLGLG